MSTYNERNLIHTQWPSIKQKKKKIVTNDTDRKA